MIRVALKIVLKWFVQSTAALFFATLICHAATQTKEGFRPKVIVQMAEYAEPLQPEQTVTLDPSVLNPALRPWVITRQYRYDADARTLNVDLALHLRKDALCGAASADLGRKSLKRLRQWLVQRPGPLIHPEQAESLTIAQWSRAVEDILTGQLRVDSESYPAKECAEPQLKISSGTAPKPKLLARAPIKWWEGRPSVRVQVEAGGVKLNGHFLVDLGAAQSSVSPMLLDFQGVPSDWFADPSRPSQYLPWVHRYTSEGFPADEGRAEKLTVSNLELRTQWLRIIESEIAGPPRSPSACCDGVLGLDALREFPVEFRTEDPGELLIWDRTGFDPGADYFALTVRETANGALYAPHCQAGPTRGVRFLTSLSGALEWSTPHAALAGKPARVSCPMISKDGTAQQWVSLTDQTQAARLGKGSGTQSTFRNPERDGVPGASLGMAFLARGRFIVDLPHGKIWFHRKVLEPQNGRALGGDWGGEVEFRTVDGERQLWWKALPGFANRWESAVPENDPKIGQWVRVRRLNGVDPSGADLWWVQKNLRQGSALELEWEAAGGARKSVSPVSAVQFPISRWKIRPNTNRR